MAFFSDAFNRVVRFFRLDTKVIFHSKDSQAQMTVATPLLLTGDYPRDVVFDLGAIGFMTMLWVSVMDAGLRHQAHMHAMLRYEDLVVAKDALVSDLLSKIGFLDKPLGQNNAAAIVTAFKSDAHGENATTSSKRFVTGAGRMFVSPADSKRVEAVIRCHSVLQNGDYVFPGTLGVQSN